MLRPASWSRPAAGSPARVCTGAPDNPLQRGRGNYFRTRNAADKFGQVDRYVVIRLKRLMVEKRGRNLHAGQARAWTEDWFNGHGLYRLRGTIRYPQSEGSVTMPRRSSVSRVRENRTHGVKGDRGNGLARAPRL
jgi:Group II intron, maturase-specific domain